MLIYSCFLFLERLSESQSLYLKHLILIRDESISTIYENFQQHQSYVHMMDEILSYMVTHSSEDNIYDDDDDDEVIWSRVSSTGVNCDILLIVSPNASIGGFSSEAGVLMEGVVSFDCLVAGVDFAEKGTKAMECDG